MLSEAKQIIRESIDCKIGFLDASDDIVRAANSIIECFRRGGKVLICGNGGSAADAQHIAGELVGRFKLERKALAAIALTTDSSVLTSIGNDYDYGKIFERQIEALGRKGDLLIGISTSGKSENVVRAIRKAKEIGIKTVSLVGKAESDLKTLSDISISVSSENTPRIQECHLLGYHVICELVEKEMAKEKTEEKKESPSVNVGRKEYGFIQ
jgi:D-sedoheptulose 7-phosphate isomerase